MSAGRPNNSRNNLNPLGDRTRRRTATDQTPTIDLTQSNVTTDPPNDHGDAATATTNPQPNSLPDVIIDEHRSTPAPVPHVYYRPGTSRPIPPGVPLVRDVTRSDPHRRGVTIGHQIDTDPQGHDLHRDVALFPASSPQSPLELRYAFAEADYGDEFGLHWMHPDNDHVGGDESTLVPIGTVVLNDYFQRLWIEGGLDLVFLYARQMVLRPGRLASGWRLAVWGDQVEVGRVVRLADVLASQGRAWRGAGN